MDGRKYTEIIMENIKQLLIHMQEMTKYYYLLYYAIHKDRYSAVGASYYYTCLTASFSGYQGKPVLER